MTINNRTGGCRGYGILGSYVLFALLYLKNWYDVPSISLRLILLVATVTKLKRNIMISNAKQ